MNQTHNCIKLTEDVAKVSGQTAWLVHPRNMACKCPANDKAACNALGHQPNDHCNLHCEFKTFKEDSDRLHSILIALANNRMPSEMIQSIGLSARDYEEKAQRSIDIKHYVDLMTNYINNLKISRTTISTPPTRTNPFTTNRGMYPTQNTPRTSKDEIGLIGYERRGKKTSL